MSGLCFNYNIQGMKLLHELKALFPSITDDAVKACMKKNNNHKERCREELRIELESSLQGRYRSRHRLKLSQRRYSAGTLSGDPYRTGENRKMRRSSVCDSQTGSSTSSWATVLAPLDQNIQVAEPKTDWSVPNKRCYESTNLSLPRKVMRCEGRRDPVTVQSLENDDCIPQDREQEENTSLKENGVPQGSIVGTRIKKPIPRPFTLAQFADIESLPTVVLTPESPPKDSGNHRRIETLYSPDSVNSHLFQNETDIVPELPKLALSMADDESMVLCGKNTTVTKTCIDLIPEHSALVLPFGDTSIQTTLATEPGTVVTKSSLSTGTLHFLKDSGDGTISIATTTFCGFQRTVVTNSLGCDAPKSSAKSTTVLYTVNSKPVICENPFRKVFAKRKQFYQAKENRDSTSPETSSKKLLWRPCNHACRRNSLCPDNRPADPPSPRYFTLNANIQPFDAFTIRHDLNSQGENNPLTTAVNLSMNSDSGFPVQLLPDAQGIMYQTKVDIPEEGAEAHLEVKVQKDGSLITTKRTGSSDCTSNEISVQLLDGGSRVSIQQSQITLPLNETKSVRPTSLHIPGSKYATVRPQSLYQGRGTSPSSVPRYNSLPNLKGVAPEGMTGGGGWGYQSHPRDEEKRIAYTRALLSHQLEQKFKLESSLRAEQGEVNHLRHEVYELELRWKRISLKSQPIIADVCALEKDISSLRGECEKMSERVTDLTGGAVALGDTSINFQQLTPQHPPLNPDDKMDKIVRMDELDGTEKDDERMDEKEMEWSCSQCTFKNHPSLDTCEICDMPRIIGYREQCTVHRHTDVHKNTSAPRHVSLHKQKDSHENFCSTVAMNMPEKIFSSAKLRVGGSSPAARTKNKYNNQNTAGTYLLDPHVQNTDFGTCQLVSHVQGTAATLLKDICENPSTNADEVLINVNDDKEPDKPTESDKNVDPEKHLAEDQFNPTNTD